jgi:hypothetical protein
MGPSDSLALPRQRGIRAEKDQRRQSQSKASQPPSLTHSFNQDLLSLVICHLSQSL